MYVFFLGVVPTIALLILLLNRRKLKKLLVKKDSSSENKKNLLSVRPAPLIPVAKQTHTSYKGSIERPLISSPVLESSTCLIEQRNVVSIFSASTINEKESPSAVTDTTKVAIPIARVAPTRPATKLDKKNVAAVKPKPLPKPTTIGLGHVARLQQKFESK